MTTVQRLATDAESDLLTNTITAIPREGQSITHNGREYTTIKEGLAHILVPHGIPTSTDPKLSKEDTQKQQVFYNPIQQFNRDLSVLAIKTFGNDLIERKRQKHEKQRSKTIRMAERKKAKKEQNNGAAEHQGESLGSNGDLSNKRKLEVETSSNGQVTEIQVENNGVTKRQRISETGDAEISAELKEKSITISDPESNGYLGKKQPEWQPSFTILDALSATGLRALRYAQEIPVTTSITANDMSSKATESIQLNIKHNRLEDKIQANTGNAIAHMYSFVEKKGYDVIDLDPYGTAVPFIDSAIQAINDEGLLCVTCTDSAIFASHGYLEKTYSQYGGLPLKGVPCHEGGLRLILHAIASSAGRYGMAIEPLLSLSIDYYIRVFVRVRRSPNEVKLLAGKTMIVYHCDNGCGSWTTQFLARNKATQNRDGTPSYKHSFAAAPTTDHLCSHCGFKAHLSGPMYGGPLHNVGFIERVLAQLNEVDRETYPTFDRIEGMLHTALEEMTFGVQSKTSNNLDESKQLEPLIPRADPAAIDLNPFFFTPSSISKVIHCSAPSLAAMRGALRHAGYKVTMSHCKAGTIRTNASWTAIWHIMLEWVRQKAPLKKKLNIGTAGYGIISKGSAHKVDCENPKDVTKDVQLSNTDPKEGEDQGSATQEKSTTEDAVSNAPSYLSADFEVKFDEELGRDHDRGKYVRYQLAPRENWGPMSRAK